MAADPQLPRVRPLLRGSLQLPRDGGGEARHEARAAAGGGAQDRGSPAARPLTL